MKREAGDGERLAEDFIYIVSIETICTPTYKRQYAVLYVSEHSKVHLWRYTKILRTPQLSKFK